MSQNRHYPKPLPLV